MIEADEIFEYGTLSLVILCAAAVLLSVLAFIVLMIISIFPVTIYQTMESGQHTGIVTAVDTSGIIWKTTDVYFKTSEESTQEDTYCVIDENLREVLKQKQINRERITLIYDDYAIIGFPLCGSSGIIRGIK